MKINNDILTVGNDEINLTSVDVNCSIENGLAKAVTVPHKIMFNNAVSLENQEVVASILETNYWSVSDFYTLCNRAEWFTSATNEEYSRAFDFIKNNSPTTENIFRLALYVFEKTYRYDDCPASERAETIAGIMFELKDMVRTSYDLSYSEIIREI